jgi:hypothetical protein
MAAKYWCSGGTGNWSSSTNWSTTATSPRTANTTAAGSSDTVIFDSISGAGTATVDSSVTIQTLTMTGFTGTLAFGTNTISCVNSGVFFTGDTTYSVTGTPLIISTYSGSVSRTITPSTPTEANSISFNISAGTGSISITTGQSVRSLIFSGTYTGNLTSVTRTFYGNLTFKTGMTVSASSSTSTFAATSGIQQITSAALNLDFPITFSGTATYQLQDALSVGTATSRTITLTSGTLDLAGFTLTHFGNFSSSNSNTRAIAFGAGNYTNTNTNTGTVFGMTTATNFTYTGTPTVNITGNAGSGITRTITFGNTTGQTEINSLSFTISDGSDTISIGGGFLNLSFAGFTGTMTNATLSIYGNLLFPTGMTLTAGTNTTTFASTNATVRTITTNSNTLDFPITFNGVGGSWQLQDALTVGTSRAITLTRGSFDSNTKTITCGTFNYNNTNTKTLTITNSSITITSGTSTSGFVGSSSGTTFNISGLSVTFTSVSSGQTALCNPNFTLPTATMSLPSGTLIIGNLVTAITANITTLTNTVTPCTFSLNTGMTGLNVANFNVNGTAGNLVVLNAVTAGTAKTITKTGGGITDVDYLNIQDSTATGGTWLAGANSYGVNTTGWQLPIRLGQGINFGPGITLG